MSADLTDPLARLQAANPVAVERDRGRGVVAQAALARILDDRASLPDRPGDVRLLQVHVAAVETGPPERAAGRVRATFVAVPVLISVIVAIAVAGVVLSSVRHHQASTAARPAAAARNGKVAFIAFGGAKYPPTGGYPPTRSEHGVTWAFDALGVTNPDGSGRQNVGTYRCVAPRSACGVYSFAWSADGTEIAFLAGHPPGLNVPTSLALYLVDANGKNPRKLASCGDCAGLNADSSIAWSPDGSRIALTRQTGLAQDLWLVNVKTGALSRPQ